MGFGSLIKGGSATPEKAPEGAAAEDTELLDDEPKNMLLALAGQLRVGMDLSKITLPVFVLEPRSMLERVTDFHSHPELLHGAGALENPEDRFIQVLRYYLAGWHIKPKGVKKPYNPVLGEIFRCRYDYKNGTTAYYVAEQVSHHPPISAFYFTSPENGIDICGELRPKSKFLGNSAATIMEGACHLMFLERPEEGEYNITMPNTYARGILFGKMVLELGDQVVVKNDTLGITCEVEFKTKGFFSGTCNAIAGKIRGPKGEIGEVSGKWSDVMEIQKRGGAKEILFDAHSAETTAKSVSPEEQQGERESRRLWTHVTDAIKAKNLDAATESKTVIEDRQREETRARDEEGVTWTPKYFKQRSDGEYRPHFALPKTSAAEQVKAVQHFIYGDDPEPPRTARSSPAP